MEKEDLAKSSDTSIEKEGFISQSLSKDGIPNQSLDNDHIGIENISVEPSKLYDAVKTQLPTAQVQRKFNALTSFINSSKPTISSANDIDDDFVLNFWIAASGKESLGDFKTFDSALRSVENFLLAYEEGMSADAFERRKTIGYDYEAGEINPEAIASGNGDISNMESLLFTGEANLLANALEIGETVDRGQEREKVTGENLALRYEEVSDQTLFLDELNTDPQKAIKFFNKRC